MNELIYGWLALYPVMWVSCIVHEFAHVVVAWRSGLRVSSAGVGVADPFWIGSWRGTRFFLCRTRPIAGITFVHSKMLLDEPGPLIRVLFAGAVANLLLMVLALVVFFAVPHLGWLWIVIAGVNGYFGIVSLLPFRVKRQAAVILTDGALIRQILRDQCLTQTHALRIRLAIGFRSLHLAVGDLECLQSHVLSAATAWLSMGDISAALRLFDEAATLGEKRNQPEGTVHQWLVWAQICIAREQWAKAHDMLDAAEARLQADLDEVGVLVVKLTRAFARIGEKDQDRAVTLLAECRASPRFASRPDLRILHIEARCRLELEGAQASELTQIREDFEALRRAHPDPAQHLPVLSLLGRAHAQQEDWERAFAYYQEGLVHARTCFEQLADEPDRTGFVAAQAGFRAEARECFLRLGHSDADRLAEVYFSPSAVAPRPAAVIPPDIGTRILRLLGIAVHAINVGLVILTLVIGAAARFETWGEGWEFLIDHGISMMLATILVPFKQWVYVVTAMVGCGIVAGFIRSLIRRYVGYPVVQRIWTAFFLALGVIPWAYLAYVIVENAHL
jgi:tetratricopeptide (TPR) repeat protein